jgi:ribonuclease HI
MKFQKEINVYTDGSIKKKKKNGKIQIYGGYGIYFSDIDLKDISKPFTNKNKEGIITINRAELHAIHQAILRVLHNYTFDCLNIYSDSEYSVKSLTVWIKNWKKNNWKNSKKKDVENQDIIKKIDKYIQKLKPRINIIWVKAHNNNLHNDIADTLANKGSDLYMKNYELLSK